MLTKTKSISITGSSSVTTDGGQNIIATMSANIDENGGISQNSFINNVKAYQANSETVDADIEEFSEYVKSVVEEMNSEE